MSAQRTLLGELIAPARPERAEARSFPVLSMTMHEGLVDQADKFKKRVASRDTAAYKVVKRHQLVVGFPIDEGVLSFQDLYDEAIVSPAYGIWDLKQPDEVDRHYLERYLRSPRALAFYTAKLRSTTARRRSLPRETFLSMTIPLPPLSEQRRIAAILDKADVVRRKRQQTLDLADQFLRSAFLDLFGDPVTNPKGWPIKKLGDVVDFASGGTPSKAKSEYWNGAIPWVSPKDMKRIYLEDALDHVSQTALNETALHLIPPESVLIVVRGMILAHTVPIGLNRVPVAINQDMKAMLPTNEMDPVFLLFALLSQHQSILSKVGTAAHGTRRLEMRDVEALPVPIPVMAQQLIFRRLASQLEHASETLATGSDCAGKLCSSLTQRAFRGEL